MEDFNEEIWELVQDDGFVEWVLFPDADNTAIWEQWKVNYPERLLVLERAREMVLAFDKITVPEVDNKLLHEVYAALDQHILADKLQANNKPWFSGVRTRSLYRWLSAAAVIAAIVAVSFFLKKNDKTVATNNIIKSDQLIQTNSSSGNRVAYLTDGSAVVLKAGASIQHAAFLQHPKREVYLKGNAFFEIAKDAERPFYVYTPTVAIRVLGTSFNVIEGKDGDLTIMVKTGKIAVYNLKDSGRHHYVVTSKHKIQYNSQTSAFVMDAINVEDTKQLPPAVTAPSFVFENTPVTDIFTALESAYSIKINASPEVFGKCMVTTALTNETFENKLKIVCTAINATYKIDGAQVYINGKPCS